MKGVKKGIEEGAKPLSEKMMEIRDDALDDFTDEKATSSGGKSFADKVGSAVDENSSLISDPILNAVKDGYDDSQTFLNNNPLEITAKVKKFKMPDVGGNGSNSSGGDNNKQETKETENKTLTINPSAIASNTVQGMVNGIQNGISTLNKSGISMANAIINGVTKTLDIHSPSRVMEEIGLNIVRGTAHGVDTGVAVLFSGIKIDNYIGKFLTSFQSLLRQGLSAGFSAWQGKNNPFHSLIDAIKSGLDAAVEAFEGQGMSDKASTLLAKSRDWVANIYKKLRKTYYKKQYQKYLDEGYSKDEAKAKAEEDLQSRTTATAMAGAYLWERSEQYAELKNKEKENAKELKKTDKKRKTLEKKYGSLDKLKKKSKKADADLKAWEKKHGTDPKKWTKEEKEEHKKLKKKQKQLADDVSKWKEYNKKIKKLKKEGNSISAKIWAGYAKELKKWKKAMKEELKERLTENFVQDINETFKVLGVQVPKNVSILVGSMNKVIDIMSVAGQAASNSISLLQSSMTKYTDILTSAADTGISIFSQVAYDWMNPSEILYNMERQTLTYDEYIAKLAEGGMRDAISMMDKCLSFSDYLTLENVVNCLGTIDYGTMFNLTNFIFDTNLKGAIGVIEDIYNSGKDIKLFVKQYLVFLLDIRKYFIGCDWSYIQMPSLDDYKSWLNSCGDYEKSKTLEILKAVTTLNSDIKYSSYPKADIEVVLMRLIDNDRTE